MAIEIERKFLVTGSGWRPLSKSSQRIRQAYLARTDAAVIRIRITDGTRACLTIKSAVPGTTRAEFEYAVPIGDAEDLIEMRVGLLIEKRRHRVPAGDGLIWEVDVFEGPHQGLVIAEIELPDAVTPFVRPHWLGAEVTGDRRYYNANLSNCMPDEA